jgi:hypothetical protein
MDALLPMARVARYGDVRGTEAPHVLPIFSGMFERALVGIAAACSALDADAAERMVTSMGSVNEALHILNRDDLQTEWRGCLDRLMRRSRTNSPRAADPGTCSGIEVIPGYGERFRVFFRRIVAYGHSV